jgi:hypothetical protein
MAAAEWMELSEPAAAAMPLVVPPVHGRRTAPAKATIFFFQKISARTVKLGATRRRRLAGYYLKS